MKESPSKYSPKVAELISYLRNGARVHKTFEVTRRNFNTGTNIYTACYWVNRQVLSARAFDALYDTKGDLVEIEHDGQKPLFGSLDTMIWNNTFQFVLTERGRTINLDSKGNIRPDGWAPKAPVEPSGPFFYLAPSANTIVRTSEKLKRLILFGEPVLQIPEKEEAEWEDLKKGYRWVGGERKKRKVKGRVQYYTEGYERVKEAKPLICMDYCEYLAKYPDAAN